MQIPKSIDPDFLKDTIVEIRYLSDLPYEVLIGTAYKILKNIGFDYAAHTSPSKSTLKEIIISNEHHFLRQNVRVTFKPGSLVFNFHKVYPKWDIYFKSIKEVITQIYNDEIITKILRSGLRYINFFKETNVFDIIKPNWRINLADFKTRRSNIKTELFHEDYRVIINVGNDNPMQADLSIIDIDVIMEKSLGIDFDELLPIIDKSHKIEKEIMFSHIVKKEYLENKKVKY